MKGEGMVLLGRRCPWVGGRCQLCTSHSSVGGFPVCGHSSDMGGASSLSMGGALSSVGYHGRVWGHIVVGRWG